MEQNILPLNTLRTVYGGKCLSTMGENLLPYFQDPISILLKTVNGLRVTFLVRTTKLWDKRTLVLEYRFKYIQVCTVLANIIFYCDFSKKQF